MNKDKLVAINREAKRELCKRSLYYFFKYFWDIISNEPLVDNWHIRALCDEAQEVVERIVKRQPKKYDLIVNVSPGTSKSSLFSVMLPVWGWIKDPTLQYLTGSHAAALAISLSVKSRDIIKSDKFKYLFPEIQLRKDIDAKQWYQNSEGGARYTCSTEGSPIGRHAHLIIVDDPIDPRATLSQAERQTTNDWFDNTLSTRKVDKEVSALILVMQRLNEDDPTGYLLSKNKGNYRHICLPARLADNVTPFSYREKYIDGLFDPVRLNELTLKNMHLDMGDYNFAGQFEQNPVPASGGLFKSEKLQVVEALPAKIVKIVRSWDKAGTQGGGCNTAGVKMALLDDNSFIVLDVVKGQWSAEQREATILQTAQLDGKTVKIIIEQEGGSGGKESAENTVKNLRGFSVHLDRPTGDKALRADPFATHVNIGNVYILRGDWNREYIEELKLFPKAKFKDQVDASSQAFNFLNSKKTINYKNMVGRHVDRTNTVQYKLIGALKIPIKK